MSQVLPIKEDAKKQLPYGLETTADLLLEFMSKSKDEQQRFRKFDNSILR